MSDLLKAAADSPLLLTVLVGVGALVWIVEKLGGVDGPLTRLVRAWQERELRRLRRERLIEHERRALREEQLAAEVDDLRRQLDEARSNTVPPRPRVPHAGRHGMPPPREPETSPMRRARNSARPPVPDR